jgi:hypothetical protein
MFLMHDRYVSKSTSWSEVEPSFLENLEMHLKVFFYGGICEMSDAVSSKMEAALRQAVKTVLSLKSVDDVMVYELKAGRTSANAISMNRNEPENISAEALLSFDHGVERKA